VTRADYDKFCDGLHHLSLDIGLRPAARALGISEARARKISSRRKWRLANHSPIVSGYQAKQSPKVTPIEAKKRILAHYSDRTQLAAAVSGAKVFEHLADQAPERLVLPATAIAGEQWSKVADRTHGWTQARQQAATVNVAVQVNLPSAEEVAERRAQHKQLDAITALINETPDVK
jgi:hypothetical protein